MSWGVSCFDEQDCRRDYSLCHRYESDVHGFRISAWAWAYLLCLIPLNSSAFGFHVCASLHSVMNLCNTFLLMCFFTFILSIFLSLLMNYWLLFCRNNFRSIFFAYLIQSAIHSPKTSKYISKIDFKFQNETSLQSTFFTEKKKHDLKSLRPDNKRISIYIVFLIVLLLFWFCGAFNSF